MAPPVKQQTTSPENQPILDSIERLTGMSFLKPAREACSLVAGIVNQAVTPKPEIGWEHALGSIVFQLRNEHSTKECVAFVQGVANKIDEHTQKILVAEGRGQQSVNDKIMTLFGCRNKLMQNPVGSLSAEEKFELENLIFAAKQNSNVKKDEDYSSPQAQSKLIEQELERLHDINSKINNTRLKTYLDAAKQAGYQIDNSSNQNMSFTVVSTTGDKLKIEVETNGNSLTVSPSYNQPRFFFKYGDMIKIIPNKDLPTSAKTPSGETVQTKLPNGVAISDWTEPLYFQVGVVYNPYKLGNNVKLISHCQAHIYKDNKGDLLYTGTSDPSHGFFYNAAIEGTFRKNQPTKPAFDPPPSSMRNVNFVIDALRTIPLETKKPK